MAADLPQLVRRLEAVTDRLENISAGGRSSAPAASAQPMMDSGLVAVAFIPLPGGRSLRSVKNRRGGILLRV